MLSSITFLALPLLSSAAVFPRHDHEHNVARQLPGSWYQRADHPVHALFKRDSQPTDGITYAQVGSDAWVNAYPEAWGPTPAKMPTEWLAALNASIAAGVIPNITKSTNHPDGVPTYPKGLDPNSPEVCSATYQCMIPGDIWNAPDGYVGLSFDDGPLPYSAGLSQFLAANNQKATHFHIGSNIIQNPQEFLMAFDAGDDICVHTWTHPPMTTLTNEQVVSELGWTMELIHNSTGGRLPKFWRPPYGDSDVRTRAIALEVFGLTTIIWNQDTNDWSLTDSPPGTSLSAINKSMTQWLTGPKSPGLIILEHELSNLSVDAFKSAYPLMKSNGWNVESLATLMGNGSAYLNAQSDNTSVTPVGNIVDGKNATVPASSSAAVLTADSSATGSSSSPSASPSGSAAKGGAAPRLSIGAASLTAAAAFFFGIMLSA